MLRPDSTKLNLRQASISEEPYKLTVGDSFFNNLDQDEIEGGELSVEVLVKKYGEGYKLGYSIKGHVSVLCDRCLTEIEYPIDVEDERLIGVEEGCNADEYDEVLTSGKEETEYSLEWPIYEITELSLPMQRVHPDGECDEQATEILRKYSAGREQQEIYQ